MFYDKWIRSKRTFWTWESRVSSSALILYLLNISWYPIPYQTNSCQVKDKAYTNDDHVQSYQTKRVSTSMTY